MEQYGTGRVEGSTPESPSCPEHMEETMALEIRCFR